MFLYQGINPDNEATIEEEFDDELEAYEFAMSNKAVYQEYTIKDLEENEVLYSDLDDDDDL